MRAKMTSKSGLDTPSNSTPTRTDCPHMKDTSSPAPPYRVTAVCSKCGYYWRLRGVAQITHFKKPGNE